MCEGIAYGHLPCGRKYWLTIDDCGHRMCRDHKNGQTYLERQSKESRMVKRQHMAKMRGEISRLVNTVKSIKSGNLSPEAIKSVARDCVANLKCFQFQMNAYGWIVIQDVQNGLLKPTVHQTLIDQLIPYFTQIDTSLRY